MGVFCSCFRVRDNEAAHNHPNMLNFHPTSTKATEVVIDGRKASDTMISSASTREAPMTQRIFPTPGALDQRSRSPGRSHGHNFPTGVHDEPTQFPRAKELLLNHHNNQHGPHLNRVKGDPDVGSRSTRASKEELLHKPNVVVLGSNDEDVCPTCLEDYEVENPKIVTKCRHDFHLSCIYEWMERSPLCPVCSKVMEFDEAV